MSEKPMSTHTEDLVFSIVIPTRSRPHKLNACLEAIAALQYPTRQFEVIVVDDGSDPPLTAVVQPFVERMNVRLLRQAGQGPAVARNAGAAQAQGTYLVFTDDDCAPAPNWLSAFESQFKRTPECLLGGQTVNALPRNVFSSASQLLIDILYDYSNTGGNSGSFFASNNFAMPLSLFRSIGGFNTTFPKAAGEDREFCDHWLHRGYKMTYVPEAVMFHAHALSLSTFWRQHFNYGRGAVLYHAVREQRESGKFRIELGFHLNPRYWLLYPVQRGHGWHKIALISLLILSQVANLSGFLWQKNAISAPSSSQASLRSR